MFLSAQAFPPRSGGIENLMAALADYAAGAGEDVHVLADGGKDASLYDQAQEKPYRITRFRGLKPLRRRAKGHKLGQLVKASDQPHYIFADSWKSLEHLPNNLTVPVIAYAHGNEYPRAKNRSHPKQARIRAALSKATDLITVSNDTAARVAPFLPDTLTPTLIHPPVEPMATATQDDKDFAENLWPNNSVRLLALCRLIEWKGLDQAIRAVGQIVSQGVPAQLVIAGIGDDRARLEALISKLGLGQHVVFAGRVEGGRKSALFASADIFVQPGRKVDGECEGYGITYVEAALHGLPTISGDAGGAPEALVDGVTGFVIDATKTQNVTDALLNLITDKPLRTKMSKAAKAHGQAALWPNQIQRILALKHR